MWFEVTEDALVVDSDRKSIGRLRAGERYRALAVDYHWVTVPGPDGSQGYVERSFVRMLADVGGSASPGRTAGPDTPTRPASSEPSSAPPRRARARATTKQSFLMLGALAVLAVAVGAGALATAEKSNPTAETTDTTSASTSNIRRTTTTTQPAAIPPAGILVFQDNFEGPSGFEIDEVTDEKWTASWLIDDGRLVHRAELADPDPVGARSFFSVTEPFDLPDAYIVTTRVEMGLDGHNRAECGISFFGPGDRWGSFQIVGSQNGSTTYFRIRLRDPNTGLASTDLFEVAEPSIRSHGSKLEMYFDGTRALFNINGARVADVSDPSFGELERVGLASAVHGGEVEVCQFYDFSVHEAGG